MGAIGDQRLKHLAQTSAWILLALVVILLVSGWGITQTGIIHSLNLGLIDRKLADYIHRASNIPLAFFVRSEVTKQSPNVYTNLLAGASSSLPLLKGGLRGIFLFGLE